MVRYGAKAPSRNRKWLKTQDEMVRNQAAKASGPRAAERNSKIAILTGCFSIVASIDNLLLRLQIKREKLLSFMNC